MHFKRITNGVTVVRALAIMSCGILANPSFAADDYVSELASDKRFALAEQGASADVLLDPDDAEVVRIAANDFIADINRVTGGKPVLKTKPEALGSSVVIIGTIGKSKCIDALIASGKLEVKDVQGLWESFVITGITDPMPGVKQALVIAGSDRRGTAYGVYELSRKIGVSPWYWWADVTPETRKALHLSTERVHVGPPAVKYRGIFINDEMWGIRPWAEGTHAPDEGKGLGPKTYARIFELLLRLRANYIWPAMHLNTIPFNCYPENKEVADRYAIVMGSSHIEPMLRNNMRGAEWDREGGGEWDYTVNHESIYQYWERSVKSNGRYENIYTIGMRGRDDEPMKGGATKSEKITALEGIFKDQREILAKHVNSNPAKVPQVFIPYTEVLDLYDAGMKVPDDVTICWPDDNFGYIRRLSTPGEQARPGGSGIYYHIQWINGATSAYAWLNTMPLSLIFTEMNKAWQYRADRLWVVNVGDIKPGEIGMEFFLEMAWNPDKWRHETIHQYLVEWAKRDLDPHYAEEIANIMEEYYQLGFSRRPEHLVQFRMKEPLKYSWFNHDHYGDEASQRLERYAKISTQVEAIYQKISDDRKDAFYQLVLYPVQCSALMNEKVIHADKSMNDAETGRTTARIHAMQARAAAESIIKLTDRYNTGLVKAGNKWQHMITWAPGPWGSQRHQYEMPPLSDYDGVGKATLLVSAEGGVSGRVADLSIYTQERRFIDLFNTGKQEIRWKAASSEPWLKLDETQGSFTTGQRLWLNIDWDKAPKGNEITARIDFQSNGGDQTLVVSVFNPISPARDKVRGFIESHGYICMEAEHFTRRHDRGDAAWKVVPKLGRCGDSVIIDHATVESRLDAEAIRKFSPALDYDIHTFSDGEFLLHLDCLPTKPTSPNRGVRLAISIDGGEPRIVGSDAADTHSDDVMSNLGRWTSHVKIDQPGKHTLTVWMVDPGVILDRIVLYTKSPRPSYFGPPESFHQ